MSAVDAISVEHGGLRIVALFNGRASLNMHLYRTGGDAPDTHFHTAVLNPADDKARARVIESLPNEDRGVLHAALMDVAQKVDMARVKRASKAKDAGSQEIFPSIDPWPEPVDAVALANDLVTLVAERIVVPLHAVIAIVLWIYHTYVADVADFTPYIHVQSPVPECGKSTLVDLMTPLVYRGQRSDRMSPAALYRRVAQLSPTVLLDELDSGLKLDGAEILRGILNSGYSRDGVVTLVVGDTHEVKDFPTYCPKMLSGIGKLWPTVESRAIPIRMQRATAEEMSTLRRVQGHRLRELVEPYRRRLQRWADDARARLRDADPNIPSALGARQSDIWRPLLAIADDITALSSTPFVAGGNATRSATPPSDAATWASEARIAAVSLHSATRAATDWATLLLGDVRGLFESQATDRLQTKTMLELLADMEDKPWPEFSRGKPITAHGIASLLGRFGIEPRNIRDGASVSKGYLLKDCTTAFAKYLTPPPAEPLHPLQPVETTSQGDGEVETEGYL